MTGARLGAAAGAGAGEPGRGDEADDGLTYETVFGIWSDDLYADCAVCEVGQLSVSDGGPVLLCSNPNCPTVRQPSTHHDKEN